MSVSVSVPTILRPQTKGEKSVRDGATLAELITDLDARYTGLGDRLVKAARCTGSSTSTSTTRTSGSPVVSRPSLADGDQVTILPAVAGGRQFGSGCRRGPASTG